jgi:hypothetical protein
VVAPAAESALPPALACRREPIRSWADCVREANLHDPPQTVRAVDRARRRLRAGRLHRGPASASEIRELLGKAGLRPRDVVRMKEAGRASCRSTMTRPCSAPSRLIRSCCDGRSSCVATAPCSPGPRSGCSSCSVTPGRLSDEADPRPLGGCAQLRSGVSSAMSASSSGTSARRLGRLTTMPSWVLRASTTTASSDAEGFSSRWGTYGGT